MDAVTLTNSSTKDSRRELDYYPTPPEVTHALMRFLQREGFERLCVWEPACGDGSMSKVIEQYGHDVFSSDLRSTGYGTSGINFVNPGVNPITRKYEVPECDAVITNPPFVLSEQFIRRGIHQAGQMDGVCAMLLKSQYWHAAKRKKLFDEHPPSWVLPLTWRPDFLFDQRVEGGKRAAPTMEVAWSVWWAGDVTKHTKYLPLGRDV